MVTCTDMLLTAELHLGGFLTSRLPELHALHQIRSAGPFSSLTFMDQCRAGRFALCTHPAPAAYFTADPACVFSASIMR